MLKVLPGIFFCHYTPDKSGFQYFFRTIEKRSNSDTVYFYELGLGVLFGGCCCLAPTVSLRGPYGAVAISRHNL
jgi:hypothetical protein